MGRDKTKEPTGDAGPSLGVVREGFLEEEVHKLRSEGRGDVTRAKSDQCFTERRPKGLQKVAVNVNVRVKQ